MNKNRLLQGVRDYQGCNDLDFVLAKHILKPKGTTRTLKSSHNKAVPLRRQKTVTAASATTTGDFWPLETGAALGVRKGRKGKFRLRITLQRVLEATVISESLGNFPALRESSPSLVPQICLANDDVHLVDVHLHQLVRGDRVTICCGNSKTSFTINVISNLITKAPLKQPELLTQEKVGAQCCSHRCTGEASPWVTWVAPKSSRI